ncbi:MAG: hypothetical protein WAU07_00050 [Microgenomates group bacterium]
MSGPDVIHRPTEDKATFRIDGPAVERQSDGDYPSVAQMLRIGDNRFMCIDTSLGEARVEVMSATGDKNGVESKASMSLAEAQLMQKAGEDFQDIVFPTVPTFNLATDFFDRQ